MGHHVGCDRAMLPEMTMELYEVPNGNLHLDMATISTLREGARGTELFAKPWIFGKKQDEAEHSIEMQLPFISHCFKDRPECEKPKIVPICVGHISRQQSQAYAQMLRPYWDDPETF